MNKLSWSGLAKNQQPFFSVTVVNIDAFLLHYIYNEKSSDVMKQVVSFDDSVWSLSNYSAVIMLENIWLHTIAILLQRISYPYHPWQIVTSSNYFGFSRAFLYWSFAFWTWWKLVQYIWNQWHPYDWCVLPCFHHL